MKLATKNTRRHKKNGLLVLVYFCVFCGYSNSTNGETASLDQLYDIVVPEPASWWPPAPGGWILFFAFITLFSILLIRWLKKYRQNAYRRAAMAELKRAGSAAEMAEILRRTALAAYPRESTASLHGADWFQWLEKTASLPLPEAVKNALTAVYSGKPSDPEALHNYVGQWIQTHSITGV